MKKITILSGKGGTGKTSIASSMALLLSEDKKVIVLDCDVDAPNLGLMLGLQEKDFDWTELRLVEKAVIDPVKCIHCGACQQTCNFGAVIEGPRINSFLCEGCGACMLTCPVGAIEMKSDVNGWVGESQTKYGFPIISGRLKMGSSGSGKIVELIKERVKGDYDVMLQDAPAGIGCPVIAAVRGSDEVILVTEPTPSALSDLKRAVKVVEHFKIPMKLIINKSTINSGLINEIKSFAESKQIVVIGELPYDYSFVEAQVGLKPVVEISAVIKKQIKSIMNYNS